MVKALAVLLFTASLASPQSGLREVRYEVDGTAKYVNLTLRNKDGGTEQKQVKLPFELVFYAPAGRLLYLSGQKVRVTTTLEDHFGRPNGQVVVYDGVAGTVHVLIRVGGAVLQEATSDAPFGIATAEGRMPE
jgi:hypothetical protein